MAKLFFVSITIILLYSCTTYREYVQVQPKTNIPRGTKYIYLDENLETIKEAFKNKGIMIKSMDGGFETEELLLDEGTRAMYKVHEFDQQVRITALWGITSKVRSQMAIYAGAALASTVDVHAWDQIIYNKNEIRPKKVFDYAVQIIEESDLNYTFR